MDFERVLKALLNEFERYGIRYAAIGGFALGVLGHVRATMDLDFLVHRDDLDKLHERLTALGYERMLQTENVSHYRHRDPAWGGLDFAHAFRKSSLAMLARAKSYSVFDGKGNIRAVDPEDVIGLKVQAMTNDPDRKPQDLSDIEALLRLYGPKLDWARIQTFYDMLDWEATSKASGSGSDVLSEEEKQEMRDLAGSQTVRDEFRLLRRLSQARPVSIDVFIQFLTSMARLHPEAARPRDFVEYKNVKL